jgi:hypothetical protein
MKNFNIAALFIAVGFVVLPFRTTPLFSKETKDKSISYLKVPPVAVVELFTSEGCSSCPPADRLASQIYKSYKSQNKPVFVLAFHVDYWDYIGWKDRFAKHEFSERQSEYGEKFNLGSIYTPQMIVNGETQFVGADSEAAEDAIKDALKTNSQYGISMDVSRVNPQQLSINYSLTSNPVNAVIHFALVEKNLSSDVKRGENSGRKLEHDNVVREFNTSTAKEKSERILKIDKDININNSTLIAYIQDRDSFKIVGAASSSIPEYNTR